MRSASGRRHYGPAELERIHQIVALKRAGLKLAEIASLSARGPTDFAALIAAQLADIAIQTERLGKLQTLLVTISAQLARKEIIDVASFCTLIRQGDQIEQRHSDGWDTLIRHYMTAQAEADFAEVMPAMPSDFDQAAYDAQWAALGSRIKAALPLDPASPAALAFLREWYGLLAPFSAVATPAMWEGTRTIYNEVDQWRGHTAPDPGFDGVVWRFMTRATEIAMARGDDFGPLPPWMCPPNTGANA